MGLFEISTELRNQIGKTPYPGEVELTMALLKELGQRSRVHYYTISQRQESEIGADWLWLIFTNAGAYGFLVQAKKLRRFGPDDIYDIRNRVRYESRAGGYQMKTLMKTADSIGIPALYVFFSNVHSTFFCDSKLKLSPEGVFFDTAKNMHHFAFEEDIRTAQCPNLMPLSCMFSSLSRKCHYRELFDLCRSCSSCGQYKACAKDWPSRSRRKRRYVPQDKLNRTKCAEPFSHFFREQYSMDVPTIDCGTQMYPLFWAETIMQKNPKMLMYCLSLSLGREAELLEQISNIVICDYTNKHDDDYVDSLLGRDVVMDYDTVWKQEEILAVLSEKRKKCRLLRKVGLFGSYAKGTAHKKSDLDIALLYKKKVKVDEEGLEELICFFKEVKAVFRKHIDFVDYNTACRKPDSKEFVRDINSHILWV